MGTRELQHSILVNCGSPADRAIDTALAFWFSFHSSPAPEGLDARIQRNWDNPVLEAVKCRILDSTTVASDRARLLAVSSPNSSDWLHALPIASCGLLLDDEAVRVAIGFRLGAKYASLTPVYAAHRWMFLELTVFPANEARAGLVVITI